MGDLKKTVLVVDDDTLFCDAVRDYLTGKHLNVIVANTGRECLSACSQKKVDIALLDEKLPDCEGHVICSSILELHENAKIIFVTAFPSFEHAVKAIKAGAHDYLSKPFDLAELDLALGLALRTADLERVEQVQRYRDDKESECAVLVGESLAEVRGLIELASLAHAPVLITGETGTGKNVAAKAIHYRSRTRTKPFISLNCAAIPENLIEAELFGYRKGAFTGALTNRKGIFELAEGGTLLLDEIGELPMHLQSKLLGVLENKEIWPIGSDSVVPVNVRVIATTNQELEGAIREKTFRRDLYYRLNVIRVHLPPLRQRRTDIPELCDFFLGKISPSQRVALPDSELERLTECAWPGNVRELRNVLDRAFILRTGQTIRPSSVLGSMPVCQTEPADDAVPASEEIVTLSQMEKGYIRYALERLSGNYSRTARSLGISLSTLKRKLSHYELVSKMDGPK